MNLERYHVMSGSEILQKLNIENPSRNTSTKDHTMMAWENLDEPINEDENDTEDYNLLENEKFEQKNLKEEEDADDEFSETSSSTDYGCLE